MEGVLDRSNIRQRHKDRDPKKNKLISVSSCNLASGKESPDGQSNEAVRKLICVLVFSFLFMVVEFGGGAIAGSLAVMTDALHLLSDVSSFAISAVASYIAARRSHVTHSFGYHRGEVLGALLSVLLIWQITGFLVFEAAHRIRHPKKVDGKLMFILAAVGVVINLIMIFVLGHGHSHGPGGHDHGHDHGHKKDHGDKRDHDKSRRRRGEQPTEVLIQPDTDSSNDDMDEENPYVDPVSETNPILNSGANPSHHHAHSHSHSHGHSHCHSHENMSVQAAFIHIVGDLVQSIGVLIAGILIWWHDGNQKWVIADPICTLLFAALVIATTLPIIRNILDIFMERVPRGFTIEKIANEIADLEGVKDVMDLHVWGLTPGIPLLTAHIIVSPGANPNEVLKSTTEYCNSIGISHVTIQMDSQFCHDLISAR